MNARLSLMCLALVLCINVASSDINWHWPTFFPRPTTSQAPKTSPPSSPPPKTSPPPKPTKTTTKPIATTTAKAGNSTTAAPGEPTLWALLVAGSNEYSNYRHQADVCHAYQVLHAHGIPDENIIVMMYDDIAANRQNPTPGIIINKPDGDDVYAGVLKDYVKKTVTPENFINVLTGNKEAMKGVGSGRVIESGPNDHVFVNFVDHGATGILGFPNDVLTAKQLNDALNQLFKENRYSKLVLYIEACEAGSMFEGVLPANINIFATTAANSDESSYACYFDTERNAYLGDVYSVKWMEDSDAVDIEKETLQTQFTTVKKETTTSHVTEYGDLTISDLVVGQFQGEQEAPAKITVKTPLGSVAASWEVPLDVLYKNLAAAQTEHERHVLHAKIDDMLEKRGQLETIVKKLVSRLAISHQHHEILLSAKPKQLTDLECHHQLVKSFSQNCFNFGKNPYAMKYSHVLANMCEQGLDVNAAKQAMVQVCSGVSVNGAIN